LPLRSWARAICRIFRYAGDGDAAAATPRRPGARCQLRRARKPHPSDDYDQGIPSAGSPVAISRCSCRSMAEHVDLCTAHGDQQALLRLAQVATQHADTARPQNSCPGAPVRRPITRPFRRSSIRRLHCRQVASGSTATPPAVATGRSS
jgi:hypothetical protein